MNKVGEKRQQKDRIDRAFEEENKAAMASYANRLVELEAEIPMLRQQARLGYVYICDLMGIDPLTDPRSIELSDAVMYEHEPIMQLQRETIQRLFISMKMYTKLAKLLKVENKFIKLPELS